MQLALEVRGTDIMPWTRVKSYVVSKARVLRGQRGGLADAGRGWVGICAAQPQDAVLALPPLFMLQALRDGCFKNSTLADFSVFVSGSFTVRARRNCCS